MKTIKQLNKELETDLAEPIFHRLLVQVDEVDEKVGRIFLSKQTQDMHQLGEVRATILAKGPTAFLDYPIGTQVPEVGDKIIFSKHAGQLHVKKSLPGVRELGDFRYLNDEDIIGVIPTK